MANNVRLIDGTGMALAVMLLCGCTPKAQVSAPPVDIAAEQAQVQRVVNELTEVWTKNDFALFSKIMAHDADMIVYGSDAPEHWIGWEPLQESVMNMLAALKDVCITVKELHIKVHPSGNVAWVSEVWDWDFVYEGNPVVSPGQRLTGVLEKRNGQWVFVQIHNSVPVAGQDVVK